MSSTAAGEEGEEENERRRGSRSLNLKGTKGGTYHEIDSAAPPAVSSFAFDPFPCKAKNCKLGVETNGWREQPVTMLIFWFGMFQLASLAVWIMAIVLGIRWLLIRAAVSTYFQDTSPPTTTTIVTAAMIVLAGPIGWLVQDAVGRMLVSLISHQLDTIWAWMLLRVFAAYPSAFVHDGLPCGSGVNFLRTTYNNDDDDDDTSTLLPSKSQSMFVVYPCRDESDAYTNPNRRQPIRYCWDSWNLLQSSADDVRRELNKQGMIPNDKDYFHAIVYVHGGGFVAANAAVLMQEAIPMARHGDTGNVVFALDYPLAPVHPFPSAVASVLHALSHIHDTYHVTHISLVGDSAGGSIVSYVATLLTSPKLYDRFRLELPSYFSGKVPWPSLRTGTTPSFPSVISLVSIYGVMDGRTCLEQPPLPTITRWENFLARHGLKFCLDCYDPRSTDDPRLPAHVVELWTLDEDAAAPIQLPPTLLVCGVCDPLVTSTRLACTVLLTKSLTVRFFHGRHALIGLPRAWLNAPLRSQAAQADAAIQEFIAKGIKNELGMKNKNKRDMDK